MLNQSAAEALLKSRAYRRPRYSLRSSLVLFTAAVLLTLSLIAPLLMLLQSAFLDEKQQFAGLENFAAYFSNPALRSSIFNSVWIALAAMLLTVAAAAVYAFGVEIYGPLGILISYCFWLFPAMVMLMMASFRNIDQRLIEASRCLGKKTWQTHMAVTLPAIRYGLVSACLVAFTYVMTDFGIPKVIGGSFNYQNFQIQPYRMQPNPRAEKALTLFCGAIAGGILLIAVTAVLASFIRYWPYDLSLTLNHYRFDYVDGGGWASYFNSIQLALFSAAAGTLLIFVIALFTERFKGHPALKSYVQMLVLLPLAVPGLVLGIAYILFFNAPENPVSALYGTMALLVISTVIHYYTVPHLTLSNAIKQIPAQLDQAAQSLGASNWKMFCKVYLPLTFPALCDVSVYLFVNAMTTVSAAIFLYSPDTSLASVAVLNMDDAGDTVAAVAMSILILATSCAVKLLHWLLTRKMMKSSQRWREHRH